jgi:hypothetical protein
MIPDGVSGARHRVHDVRVLCRRAPEHEERGVRPMRGENLQQATRPQGMRPVVEGQRDER